MGAIQIDVSYPSFFSFTLTRTKATRVPSGEICGSATQMKSNRSFSVMNRFGGAFCAIKEVEISKRRRGLRQSERLLIVRTSPERRHIINGACTNSQVEDAQIHVRNACVRRRLGRQIRNPSTCS